MTVQPKQIAKSFGINQKIQRADKTPPKTDNRQAEEAENKSP